MTALHLVAPIDVASERDRRSQVHHDVIYEQVSTGVPCWIADTTGARAPLEIERWLGGPAMSDDDRMLDAAVVAKCTGPTLDIGCGPGRLTAALNKRGVTALGLDISAYAVEMTMRRGAKAVVGDIFSPLPRSGEWAHVLLADGNIGIGGDPLRMLLRARDLLGPGGTVIAELDPTASGVQRDDIRWETRDHVGHWFPWARVGCDVVHELGAASGLQVTETICTPHRSVAIFEQARGREERRTPRGRRHTAIVTALDGVK